MGTCSNNVDLGSSFADHRGRDEDNKKTVVEAVISCIWDKMGAIQKEKLLYQSAKDHNYDVLHCCRRRSSTEMKPSTGFVYSGRRLRQLMH